MEQQLDISIVIPVYNSAGILPELYAELSEELTRLQLSYEVFFIDDGSSDSSWKTLQSIKQQDTNHVGIVRLTQNYGQHNATLCGLRYTRADKVLTLDDDMEHNPADIERLLQTMKAEKADVVYAVTQQNRNGVREVGSKVWKVGSRYIDESIGQGSSFRLMNRKVVDKVCAHQQNVVFIDEILQWYTGQIAVLKTEFRPRKSGRSGYTPVRLWKLTANLSLNYSTAPLKIMTWVGFSFAVIFGLVGAFFILRKIYGSPAQGFTGLIVAILFSTSILLFCLGIIGQYIARIFTTLNHKPSYWGSEQELLWNNIPKTEKNQSYASEAAYRQPR